MTKSELLNEQTKRKHQDWAEMFNMFHSQYGSWEDFIHTVSGPHSPKDEQLKRHMSAQVFYKWRPRALEVSNDRAQSEDA